MKSRSSFFPLTIGCLRTPRLLSRAVGCLIVLPLFLDGGCASRARPVAISPNTSSNRINSGPAYVTLPLDDTATEWEFVQWLRAGGVEVEKDSNGDDRIFDTPACRAILVLYRRMLHVHLDVIAQNLANVNSTHDAQGAKNPYRRRFVVAANASEKIETREDPSPFLMRYMPGNPDADSKGYVSFPNVDPAIENVNAIQASKSYRVVTRILMRFDPTFLDIDGGGQANPLSVSSSHDAEYNEAVEQTLAGIISHFPGVSDANVIIKAKHDQPVKISNPPQATVQITTAGNFAQPRSLVAPAADTLVHAVSGLTLENVSVLINGVSYHAADSSSP